MVELHRRVPFYRLHWIDESGTAARELDEQNRYLLIFTDCTAHLRRNKSKSMVQGIALDAVSCLRLDGQLSSMFNVITQGKSMTAIQLSATEQIFC